MCKRAIYPGSFDPLTYGHIDLIKRALNIFSEVIVAVAQDSPKKCIFSVEERIGMLRQATQDMTGVVVESFKGLVVDFARSQKVNVILRGIRMISDFEYEFQMALTNRRLASDIETVFLMPSESYSYLSSRLLKEAGLLGADLSNFVPDFVAQAFRKRLKQRQSKGR